MEIAWYGHACFRLRDKGATVVTDPYDQSIGYTLPKIRADIVTVSHNHADHNYVSGIKNAPKVVDGPGEYEIKGVFITGIATFHDRKKGAQRGRNTVFLLEFNGLTICHLGDLGHVPTQAQVEALSDVDVLLIPVGGVSTIGAPQAAEVISLLEPKIVIPMHYKTKALTLKLASVNRFLQEMGLKKLAAQESLKVTTSTLPEETQIVLLDHKQG
jgi:L-ascorbate metabolism protein UlaG (beta-lactamase superfamily)